MGAIHALRVKSPYQLLKIEKIEIENKPNEHGYLYLKCLIDDSINFQSTINASTDDKICVYEEIEDKNLSGSESPNINIVNESKSKIIFNGTVQNIRTSNLNGVYHLEIQALTSSFELDIKEKSRSFQNTNMTYDELIGKVLKDYSGHSFTQWVGEGQKIGKPLFQYKETDWSFLKRVASELNSQLFCDIIERRNMLYFGTPVKASYKLDDMTHYKAFKNLEQFHKVSEINNGHDTDYFYYEIEKREKYDVGDRIHFKNKELYVKEFSACGIDNEVVYKYRLCRKNGIWQTKIYNSLIGGASLEGKVLAVEGEKVKLHLKIDDNQSEDEVAWFPYAPPTGNVMYSMPIVGTEARLYFPSENGENPRITGCVRTNGSSCAKTSDTTKRYFGTEHGSELEMTPGALNIKGGSKEPLNISIDDEIGVTITSLKKLTLAADDEIIMKTPKSVKLKAESQILVAKENSQSGFSLENEMHFKSNNVIKNGSCRDTYEAFKDEPEAGQKPPAEEEKSGFNWGGLLMAAAAAVAVVAAVATLGIGAAIVGAVAVACIGAICSSSVVAAGVQSAMGALAINNFNGALCGADLGLFSKSWDSLKEIGYDIYDGLKNRADKALDSPYDFVNWLTLGVPDIIKGAADAYVDRANKAFDSPYDFINCASLGIADMANGAVNPEEPLSKEHWINSFGLVSLMFGINGSKTGAGKAGLIEDVPKSKITKVAGGEVESILDEGAADASKAFPTKIPYEFMNDTADHIFKGAVKDIGTASERATGWHYIGNDIPKGNKILQITRDADKFGTIEARVEIGGVTKKDISTFFSNKYTPNEVVDMLMQAHMNKTLVPGSRGLYRGVADNGMTIEMYLYRNPEGCNISDIITAYPVHVDTLK